METEIKTLVYRDRAVKKVTTVQKRRVLNKRLASVVAALLVVVIAGVAALTMGIGEDAVVSASDAEQKTGMVLADAAAQKQENENELIAAAQDSAIAASANGADIQQTNRDEANQNGTNQNGTNQTETAQNATVQTANAASVISSVASNVGFEDSIVLMLLSDMVGDQEEDNYIPATLGQREDAAAIAQSEDDVLSDDGSETDEILAFENSITAGADSRLEAVEAIAELLIGPADVPEGLVYEYNPDMQLNLTAHEIEVLQRIVEAEATGMSVYGKMLVANVVINRVNSRYFAGDVESVVFQRIGGSYQFSPVKDGRYYSVKVTDTTREAVERVLSGEDYSEGALYFFQRSATSNKKATWFDKNLKFLFKFGAHEFFTEYKK